MDVVLNQMLFLNILNECVTSSFFFCWCSLSWLDSNKCWPLMKTDLIQGSKVFWGLCIVWEEGGEIILSFSFSSLRCPLCLSLLAFFWHQPLNSGPENLWLFFAQLGLSDSFLPGISLLLRIPLSSGCSTYLASCLADACAAFNTGSLSSCCSALST